MGMAWPHIEKAKHQHYETGSKMYYGKQLSRIARLLCIYENRDQAACSFMQNAAVQKIFCTELDTL